MRRERIEIERWGNVTKKQVSKKVRKQETDGTAMVLNAVVRS